MNSDQTLHFVTGKGGVGKSTLAAGLAMRLAKTSGRTLLIELGERSFYSHIWGKDFGFEPLSVTSGLSVCRWQGEDCLKEYLQHLLKVPKLADLFFENRVMKALVDSAPALKELAIVGKLTSGIRDHGPKFEYRHLVLDAYSTGHFKALFNAPVGMGEAIGFGPMGEQSREIIEVLKNPDLSQVYIVSLPEELPIKEGLELSQFIRSDFGQSPQWILNKSLGLSFGDGDIESLTDSLGPLSEESQLYLQALLNRWKEGEFLRGQLGSEEKDLWEVPHFFQPAGEQLYESIASHFEEQSYA